MISRYAASCCKQVVDPARAETAIRYVVILCTVRTALGFRLTGSVRIVYINAEVCVMHYRVVKFSTGYQILSGQHIISQHTPRFAHAEGCAASVHADIFEAGDPFFSEKLLSA